MSEFDITVAVTAHSETVVAGPTMRSAGAAIGAAEATGLRVEKLIGLDSPTNGCRAFFSQAAFHTWKRVDIEVRDLGLARNQLAKIATGRLIAFLDADDLFSENWLYRGAQRLVEAERNRQRIIAHPEINFFFDGAEFILVKPAQDDPLFTPYYFYFGNYWDSLCMAPRSAVLDTPYLPRDRVSGFAYEDWQWNIETMANGWGHVSVDDTIVFKRRRDASLVVEISQLRAVVRDHESMRIDRMHLNAR